MTSADVESGLLTDKNLFRNENTDTLSHYDPEIRKLLQEISIDTKATRKMSEAHAKLFRDFCMIFGFILILYFLYGIASWIIETHKKAKGTCTIYTPQILRHGNTIQKSRIRPWGIPTGGLRLLTTVYRSSQSRSDSRKGMSHIPSYDWKQVPPLNREVPLPTYEEATGKVQPTVPASSVEQTSVVIDNVNEHAPCNSSLLPVQQMPFQSISSRIVRDAETGLQQFAYTTSQYQHPAVREMSEAVVEECARAKRKRRWSTIRYIIFMIVGFAIVIFLDLQSTGTGHHSHKHSHGSSHGHG